MLHARYIPPRPPKREDKENIDPEGNIHPEGPLRDEKSHDSL
jgi:hypothetical protein